MTFPLYLRTLSSIITVPLWAYPPHYTRALASGEIPATSRLRVCVGLLSVESVRGCPSPRLTFDAAFRVPLSAGCTVDGSCKFPHLAALARSCAVALGIVSFLDPVFPVFGAGFSLVKLVPLNDGSRMASLALPLGSSPSGSPPSG